MTPEEKQVIDRLCLAVIREQNPAKLTELVNELNRLLELRERKRHESDSATQSPPVRIVCAICGNRVDLVTCRADGDGKAVHSECLTAQLKQKPATQY